MSDELSRLRLALKAGRIGTWEWVIRTGEVLWSEEVEAIHGLEPGSFGGTLEDWKQDMHPDDRERVLEIAQRAARGDFPDYQVEYRVVLPGGEVRWLEARGTAERDESGAPIRLLGVCRDCTDRKRADRRLQLVVEASRAISASPEYEAALQALADFLASTMADYCVTYSYEDDGTIRRVGTAHQDPAKRPLVEALAGIAPPRVGDEFGAGAVIRTGEPVFISEISESLLERSAQSEEHLRLLRKLAPRSSIVAPLQARGQTVGAVALATTPDSEQSYTEEDFKIVEKLASRTALVASNARLYGRAQEAVRLREEVMSILSHDLKNPLQNILTACSLLRDSEAPPERRGRSLAIIRRSAERMNSLIKNLLDVARLDAGRLSVDPEPVEVSSLLSEVTPLFQQVVEQKSLHLEQTIEPGLPEVLADRSYIQQVVTNLLGNAVRFAPEGGRVRLGAERRQGEVSVWISDTGPGIPEAQLPHIFDRFWKAEGDDERGTGLGLAIAKGIVEAHGGAVEVESAEGTGATFRFTLPSADAPAGRAREERHVLVIDDDEQLRREVIEILQERGYKVTGASDGQKALEYLATHPAPGLILLDLMMPVMDGWEFLTLMKTDPKLSGVPVVILSCVDRERTERELPQAVAYLEKPLPLEKLFELARRNLEA